MFFKKKKEGANGVQSNQVIDADLKRRQSISSEELSALNIKLAEAYQKLMAGEVQANSPYFPSEIEKITLLAPDRLLEYWSMSKDVVKKEVFGVGGVDYLPRDFGMRRCALRLSMVAYSRAGITFPEVIFDFLESLTQMDEGDAKEWCRKNL